MENPIWKEFAQKEDLTVRLSNILQDYAFGPGVFRELLQNADDAGASRFALYADAVYHSGYCQDSIDENHPTGLLDPRLASWQGPAVMAFNDAVFSDQDFEGICRVGASIKRSDDTKIGRYGLGFNATYHLTDVVSFVSNDQFCIFDPHRRHLPSNLPGLQLVLTDTSRTQFSAQLAPFSDVQSAESGDRPWASQSSGSIFRLPLRTEKLAAKSSISQQAHTLAEVTSLLRDFLAAAGEALLFLQCVEEIEVRVRENAEIWSSLGSVQISTASLAATQRLRKERQLLKNLVDDKDRKESRDRTRRTGFALTFTLRGAARLPGTSQDEESTAWLVVARAEPVEDQAIHRSGSDSSPSPSFRLGSVAVPLFPWSGGDRQNDTELVRQDAEVEPARVFQGQAYCFLPLSLTTGLPVHISGNFAVSANRRDLWRRSDDQKSSESNLRASWNEALLEKTCPRAYADALELLAAGLLTPGRAPSKLPFKAENFIPDKVFAEMRGVMEQLSLWWMWPSTSKGHFAAIPRCVSQEVVARDAAVFYAGQEFVDGAPGAPVFRTAKSSLLCSGDGFQRLSPELRTSISRLCLAGRKRSPVQVPSNLCEVLMEIKGTTWLEPQSLAVMLRGFDTRGMPSQEADALVEYILYPEGKGSLSLLHGLALCPLLSGRLGTFLHRTGGEIACQFLWADDADFKELFPDRDFVDPASGTFRLLKPRIATSNLNIQILGEQVLPSLLANIFPAFWRCKSEVALLHGKVFLDGQPQEEVQKTSGQTQKEQRTKPKEQGYAFPSAPKVSRGKKSKLPKANWGKESADDGFEDAYSDYWEEPEDFPVDKPDSRTTTAMVRVSTTADMDLTVRRCELLWKLVEGFPDKSNGVQLLQDLPCIPVLSVSSEVRLMSCYGAQRQHLLSVEDYTAEEAQLLSSFGCFLARPGKKLRTFLGIERALALNALLKAVAQKRSSTSSSDSRLPQDRMFLGMKDMRLDVEMARPLQRLVCSILLRSTMKKKDVEKAMALPIFDTKGGSFAVPLTPGASIIAPSEEWEELLGQFKDFVLNFDADADGGQLIREMGIQRGNLPEFLATFCSPRAGLFDQKLSVHFLESVASLGSAVWKKNVQKDYVTIRSACEDAPVVVDNSGRRFRCSELVDPEDVQFFAALNPPREYCSPVVLSVLRKAGLKSLTDEEMFLSAARHVEATSQGEATAKGKELLALLATRFPSLKWSSKSFAALSHIRIFPAVPVHSDAQPPDSLEHVRVMSLDVPCTLFQHASVAWTQLPLLHPGTFAGWPKPLLQRFSAIKDPPPLDVVVANLIEVARRWETQEATDKVTPRQQIVVYHLAALDAMRSRSHAMQNMVQHSLCMVKFLVMDDGSLTSPCQNFAALHAGGASDEETEETPWSLPRSLRPYRRLLLGIAGPALHGVQQLPTIHVQPKPTNSVPEFIQNSLNCPDLADVVFILCHEEQIYAHRLVLAASSEHFRAMFSKYSEAAEAKCRLELPSWVSARPMLWMLAYLYQGYDPTEAQQVAFKLSRNGSSASSGVSRRTSLSWKRRGCQEIESEIGEDLCCLLRLSEYYQLDHLKEWTESQLGKLLTPENVVSLSTHAYFCNASQLLRVSIYHLRRQYAELVGIEDWEELEPAIKELVLANVSSQTSETEVA